MRYTSHPVGALARAITIIPRINPVSDSLSPLLDISKELNEIQMMNKMKTITINP